MKEKFNSDAPYSRRDVLRTISGAAALSVGGAFLSNDSAVAAPSESDLKIAEVKTYIMDDATFVRVTTDSGLSERCCGRSCEQPRRNAEHQPSAPPNWSSTCNSGGGHPRSIASAQES